MLDSSVWISVSIGRQEGIRLLLVLVLLRLSLEWSSLLVWISKLSCGMSGIHRMSLWLIS
jgi:hypothetical protein